jgi:hypothetical protein
MLMILISAINLEQTRPTPPGINMRFMRVKRLPTVGYANEWFSVGSARFCLPTIGSANGILFTVEIRVVSNGELR